MFRVRRIYNTALPADADKMEQALEIFRSNFGAVAHYADKIRDQLNHPFHYGFRAVLFVVESPLARVNAFAYVLQFPEINAVWLDFMAVRRGIRSGGIGGALYQAVREHARSERARGIYLESLPDNPAVVTDPEALEQNRRRLLFYERYGARPMINTAYETPISPAPAPHLLFDPLGRPDPLGRDECRAAVRLILQRVYGHRVTAEYIQRVVDSIQDDPVQFRPPRRKRAVEAPRPESGGALLRPFALVSSPHHEIHHVRETGYVERPVRVKALLESLRPTGLFDEIAPQRHGEEHIRAVHDPDFVSYLRVVCEKLDPRRPVYPYVFPIRRPERKPKELAVRAGYYCIDTFTPLDRNAYQAARASVDVALTAAEDIRRGRPVAYALCRPPGHHAEAGVFGGFCYFNNAAIAAHRLSREGKVAMLDIDFHHGNGSQYIFWRRDDVFTQSIHGHPNFAYPYFSGFADEVGEGPGHGFNRNYPLPERTGGEAYLRTFREAVDRLGRFRPAFVVVSLGFDTMKGDPTGDFTLGAHALETIGQELGAIGLPLLIVQEGGYSVTNLRRGAPSFFRGLARALVRRQRAVKPAAPG